MFKIIRNFSEKNLSLTTTKAFAIFIIIGSLIFFNGLFNSFVGDDTSQIVNNKSVHSLTNIQSSFTGSTFYGGGGQTDGVYYKPLLSALYMFIYSVSGPNPFPFHLFQVALHIVNSFMVFLLLKHFFKRPLSFILSLVFLVHPMNSEAVFYISAAQEVLFFFFGISAIKIFTDSTSKKSLIPIGLLLLASIFSKETGIIFFFVLLAYSYLFRRKRFYSIAALSSVLFVIYLFLRVNAVGILNKSTSSPISNASLWERILNMPAILFYYVKTFFFPLNIAYSQHWINTKITMNSFLIPLVFCFLFIVLTLSFLVILYKKRSKYLKTYIFFFLWFFLGIGLLMQIFPLDVIVADRLFYLPMVGIFGMTASIVEGFNFNIMNRKILFITLSLILLFSWRTIVRSFDWRDNMTLAIHDNKVSQSYVLENTIGFELIKKGKPKDGAEYIKRSIELYPYFTNYNNLGLAYLHLREYDKAKEAYLRGLDFGDYYLLYENLAELALVHGDVKENIGFIENVSLRKFPQNSKMWLFLAILKYDNDIKGAKDAISKAYFYSKDPTTVSIYNKIMNNQPLKLNIQMNYWDYNN